MTCVCTLKKMKMNTAGRSGRALPNGYVKVNQKISITKQNMTEEFRNSIFIKINTNGLHYSVLETRILA